jgi:hypothetical protein
VAAAAVTLDSDDVDAIADALAERLDRRLQFVDARGLAELLGVSPDVVYERADELGACRLGARLIFDVDEAVRRMRRIPAAEPVTRGTGRRRSGKRSSVPLLPIRSGERS